MGWEEQDGSGIGAGGGQSACKDTDKKDEVVPSLFAKQQVRRLPEARNKGLVVCSDGHFRGSHTGHWAPVSVPTWQHPQVRRTPWEKFSLHEKWHSLVAEWIIAPHASGFL